MFGVSEKEEIHARVIFAQVQRFIVPTSFHILTAQGQNVSEKMFTNGYDSCPRYQISHCISSSSSSKLLFHLKIQAKLWNDMTFEELLKVISQLINWGVCCRLQLKIGNSDAYLNIQRCSAEPTMTCHVWLALGLTLVWRASNSIKTKFQRQGNPYIM